MSASRPRILHFTLGPVQGFIAQARRTRDLWAGSFLLSWLTGRAMRAIVAGNHGRILFPKVEPEGAFRGDPLFQAIMGQSGDNPFIGSLPNRFKAEITDAGFEPRCCGDAVISAWKTLADRVRDAFLDGCIAPGSETERIWNRQIESFWEIDWVIGPPDGTDDTWLDRRKNWRTARREAEGPSLCTIMADWQELSGHGRAGRGPGRELQDQFWDRVRGKIAARIYGDNAEANTLELGGSERLSAIALVKRLFPLLPETILKDAIGWVPDMPANASPKSKPGLLRIWPSTAYVAAVPWMRKAWSIEKVACNEFQKAVEKTARIYGVSERGPRVRNMDPLRPFADVDGRMMFKDDIRSDDESGLSDNQAERITGALKELERKLGDRAGPPSPFYAVLLMDGDRVGTLIRTFGAREVSEALSTFTDKLESIVDAHWGVTIYAGGDDFLGFFPLDEALLAAMALRDAYVEALARVASDKMTATTSAGLVFAHYRVPLSAVLREARALLEHAAKDGNQRNSLAVSVLKPSGKTIEWVSGWKHPDGTRPTDRMLQLATSFAADEATSGSFLYNVDRRFVGGPIGRESDHPAEGTIVSTLGRADLTDLLTAERLKGKALHTMEPEMRRDSIDKAKREVEALLSVCITWTGDVSAPTQRPFDVAGAMLARFLAQHQIGS